MAPEDGLGPGVRQVLERPGTSLGNEGKLIAVVGRVPAATTDDEELFQMVREEVVDLEPRGVVGHMPEQGSAMLLKKATPSLVVDMARQVWSVNEEPSRL